MTTYNWANLYAQAVDLANGDRPGIELEGRIVERFNEDPIRVDQAIQRIGNAYQRGDIRSFWAVLDTDLSKPTQPRFNASATAKTKSPWHSTGRRDWEPELPPAPRQLPDFVSEFMQRNWPKPLEEDACETTTDTH